MLISKSKFLEKENLFFSRKISSKIQKLLMDLTLKRLTDNQVTASVKNSKIQKFKRLRFPWSISFLIRKLDFVHVKLYRGVETSTFIDRGENGRVRRVKEDGLIGATKMGCPKVTDSSRILNRTFGRLLCLLSNFPVVPFADLSERSKPNPKNS